MLLFYHYYLSKIYLYKFEPCFADTAVTSLSLTKITQDIEFTVTCFTV